MTGPNDFEVSLDVSIRNYQGGGNLQLRENVTIPDCTFSDMADILRGFHELSTSMAAAKKKAAGE
jgi:hypothetical protein